MNEVMIQTIAVLAASVLVMAKQGYEIYKKRSGSSNGNGMDCETKGRMLRDLHEWHQPRIDSKTGQPRFHWYYTDASLLEELQKNRNETAALRDAMQRTNESMERLISAIEEHFLSDKGE